MLMSSRAKAVKGLRGFDLEDPYGVYVKRQRGRRPESLRRNATSEFIHCANSWELRS